MQDPKTQEESLLMFSASKTSILCYRIQNIKKKLGCFCFLFFQMSAATVLKQSELNYAGNTRRYGWLSPSKSPKSFRNGFRNEASELNLCCNADKIALSWPLLVFATECCWTFWKEKSWPEGKGGSWVSSTLNSLCLLLQMDRSCIYFCVLPW